MVCKPFSFELPLADGTLNERCLLHLALVVVYDQEVADYQLWIVQVHRVRSMFDRSKNFLLYSTTHHLPDSSQVSTAAITMVHNLTLP